VTDKLKWTDAEQVAVALHEAMPQVNPLTIRFTDLHRLVCQLQRFDDDPKASD